MADKVAPAAAPVQDKSRTLDLTPESAAMLAETHRAMSEAQRTFAVAFTATVRAHGIADARFAGLDGAALRVVLP
jgi:hypothetical protein